MPHNLRVLGNVFLPENVALVLKNGPKFSVVPMVSAHELLALNQGISRRDDEENRERCLLEGADSLLRNRRNDRPKLTTGGVVSYFKQHELSLLQADKEGGFVVMSTSSFLDKASSAIMKNFESTIVKASKGGLRGVVWTDCVQAIVILAAPATIIVKVLWDASKRRLRPMTLEDFKPFAFQTAWWGTLLIIAYFIVAAALGLIMAYWYRDCDPMVAGVITSLDQV
ncbi:hypothetical protein HPB51_005019 [Rhipicephalus microplus]|uniref:Uncharacterized protein n=1 Tax=Rhipicephalus microplus TaxID=6941 RepID=A0A9J6EYM6_RHIMP|nr:hypothetical protein HPB51_005019 [Rhipicephalus microplus]